MNTAEFDYIIVGAGSAGSALAYRLSEHPSTRVLVIEAGGRDLNPLIAIPLGWPRILQSRMDDWMYFSEPEPELGNREIECARGRVLGGSSSINAMAFVRGHRGDYDRWASTTGLDKWSYAHALPYFRRLETWEGGSDAYRGDSGPVRVQFSQYSDPLAEAFTAAGMCAGYAYTPDYNGAQQEGFGRWQATIHNGRRWSAADAYLRPSLQRKNVSLTMNSLVTRVIFSGIRAQGVEFVKSGRRRTAYAAREVILCGGAINTPQLLNLSGVGHPDELRSGGIATLVALKGVGKNLQDHISASATYLRKQPGPLHQNMRIDRIARELTKAYFFGTGIATDLPSGPMAFLKSSFASTLPDIQLIPIAAPMSAAPYLRPFRRSYVDAFAIRAAVLRPESRGYVRLKSGDANAAPIIVQNFLATQRDRELLRDGIRIARDVGSQQPLSKFTSKMAAPSGYSDDELDEHINATGISVHHPVGTCKMGAHSDSGAVVDGELRVMGLEGLRVVDASVMPDLIGGNINAAVFMIAEKAADLIQQKPPLSPATVSNSGTTLLSERNFSEGEKVTIARPFGGKRSILSSLLAGLVATVIAYNTGAEASDNRTASGKLNIAIPAPCQSVDKKSSIDGFKLGILNFFMRSDLELLASALLANSFIWWGPKRAQKQHDHAEKTYCRDRPL
ncbi:GMC family oxidoreductase [Pseudorhodoplanes sp.]|uniref:GMC family oxidoreductase n=1 Tax=Pseudorhodoplanes sp. TaxID=1934341 RepID=UPI003D0C7945